MDPVYTCNTSSVNGSSLRDFFILFCGTREFVDVKKNGENRFFMSFQIGFAVWCLR